MTARKEEYMTNAVILPTICKMNNLKIETGKIGTKRDQMIYSTHFSNHNSLVDNITTEPIIEETKILWTR